MQITGYYTTRGAQLAAKIQAGTDLLRVSRIVGGQGATAPSANKMAAEKQALTGTKPKTEGANVVIVATLTTAVATVAYTLNEVGIYATDNQGAEVLYKVYKLDKGVDINNTFNLVIQFTLIDSVLEQGKVAVETTVSGMITEADAKELVKISVVPDPAKSRTISCAASQLQAQIDALPRNLEGDIVFKVSAGTLAGNLEIKDFCGGGSVAIVGASMETVIVSGYAAIYNCNLKRVGFKSMTIAAGKLFDVTDAEEIYVKKAAVYVCLPYGDMELNNVTVTPQAALVSTCCGVYGHCRRMYMFKFLATKRQVFAFIKSGCRANFQAYSVREADGCHYGVYLCSNTIMISNIPISEAAGSTMHRMDEASIWIRYT